MTRQTVTQTPVWCGIHYLLYLRRPGAEEDSARFSLFQTEYSPAGGGNAGFLYLDGGCIAAAPANGVYTDNPALAAWLYDRMYRGKDNPLADCERPVTARFVRSGDMRRALQCGIDAAEVSLTASWTGLEAPFVHHGLAGASNLYTYCLFAVANGASLVVNGEAVPGAVYARQDWIALVGRPLSSCLIADEIWAAP